MTTGLQHFRAKKIGILGFGAEGKALLDFFLKHDIIPSVYDVKEQVREFLPPNFKGEFVCGAAYLDSLDQIDIVFRSPGIPRGIQKLLEAEKKGVEISSATKLFFELCRGQIIGVTGTKGKGTTATLIYEILRAGKKEAYLGGNIGAVLLDQLSTIDDKTFVVLELSSFQLEDLDVSPHYAVVLGIMPEHLDHHQSAENYFSAKSNIVAHQTPKDRVVLCADNQITKRLATGIASKKYWVSTQSIAEPGGYQVGGQLCFNLDGREEIICQTDELQLAGKHNWQNVLAAVVIARLAGVDIAHIRQAVLNFRGLPHRLQIVGTYNGVTYVNDSLSTIPESAIAAIETFLAPKIMILGGSEKFSNYRDLARKIAASNVRAVFLIGQTSPKIKKALQDAEYSGVISDDIDNLQDIVRGASSIANRGDVVLLSPASASFGLFKDYADRGRQFEQAVKKLIEHDETGQT